MVIQHERQHNPLQHEFLPTPSDSNVFFNSSNNRRPHFGRGRGGWFSARGESLNGGRSSSTYSNKNLYIKTCTFCGHSGQTIKTCYGVHGYPLGHPQYPGKMRLHRTTTVNCAAIKEVFEQGTYTKRENTIIVPNLSFNQAQYDKLMTLLQHPTCAGTGSGHDDFTVPPHKPHPFF